MIVRWIPPGVLLLIAVSPRTPVCATTAVTPDSLPTIQAALDSHRALVRVRTGQYAEDLRRHSAVVLRPFPS